MFFDTWNTLINKIICRIWRVKTYTTSLFQVAFKDLITVSLFAQNKKDWGNILFVAIPSIQGFTLKSSSII